MKTSTDPEISRGPRRGDLAVACGLYAEDIDVFGGSWRAGRRRTS